MNPHGVLYGIAGLGVLREREHPKEEVTMASLKQIRQRLEWARMHEEGIVRDVEARVEKLAEHRRIASEMAEEMIADWHPND